MEIECGPSQAKIFPHFILYIEEDVRIFIIYL